MTGPAPTTNEVHAEGPAAARWTRVRGPGRFAAGALLIAAVVVVAYLPALRGAFIWDDESYVTQNVHLRTWSGLRNIWFDVGATKQYYPAVHTSFWIEYHLWRLDPLGYHVSNVLLHAVGAILLWQVLRRLSVPGAWLAAAVFALHPVQVESVAWVTERKNVMSDVFYFAALLSYIRFSDLRLDRVPEGRPRRYYALSVLLFGCALCSKTVTCSLPAVILLLMWWKRKRLRVGEVLPVVPMFALGLALGLLTAYLEKYSVGALGEEWGFTFRERCLLAGRALWVYFGKLVYPTELAFI